MMLARLLCTARYQHKYRIGDLDQLPQQQPWHQHSSLLGTAAGHLLWNAWQFGGNANTGGLHQKG